MLTKVIKAKYVYEFDLEKFFDTVPAQRVLDLLQEKGLPTDFYEELKKMCQRHPKLPPVLRMDETNEIRKSFWFGSINTFLKRMEKPS